MAETPLEVFEKWRLLYQIEPWADERTDFAIGTAIMHNVAAHGVESKQPDEYMHYLRIQKAMQEKPQSEEDMKAAWTGICETRRKELEDER